MSSKLLKDKEKGISSLTLRVIGIIATAACVVSEALPSKFLWISGLGWFAFAIFAFLLKEGFTRTSDRYLYGLRILVFALVAEIPHNLIYTGDIINTGSMNVMFTLFIGFLCMAGTEFIRKRYDNVVMNLIALVVLTVVLTKFAIWLNCLYARLGIPMIMLFYEADKLTYRKLTQILFFVYICVFVTSDFTITPVIFGLQYPIPIQVFALPALILIWFYNGKRGPNSLAFRRLMYCFYPALLFLIMILMHFGVL